MIKQFIGTVTLEAALSHMPAGNIQNIYRVLKFRKCSFNIFWESLVILFLTNKFY